MQQSRQQESYVSVEFHFQCERGNLTSPQIGMNNNTLSILQ